MLVTKESVCDVLSYNNKLLFSRAAYTGWRFVRSYVQSVESYDRA